MDEESSSTPQGAHRGPPDVDLDRPRRRQGWHHLLHYAVVAVVLLCCIVLALALLTGDKKVAVSRPKRQSTPDDHQPPDIPGHAPTSTDSSGATNSDASTPTTADSDSTSVWTNPHKF
ncbi:uncharacterized protein [Dermacentor albipictus]|uniref:uncharacterized protein isoform X2 n=1 Tax=Dermacentor albipictus TaxID=60249 RepID=UPI0031FE2E0D